MGVIGSIDNLYRYP